MFSEFHVRLKRLGVPFFGTKAELVRSKEKKNGELQKGMIEQEDLEALQKKMIGILEDLCKA